MNSNEQLPLRNGVGIILLNKENKVFVGKRIDNPENFWQMPQGGVDQNENFLQAAKRELEEETAVKSVQLIKEIDDWHFDTNKNTVYINIKNQKAGASLTIKAIIK